VAELAHTASRDVDQRPDVVHDRLLELSERLKREAPPIPAGTQPAMLLGIDGSLGIEVADGGPGRIELRTTRGRIRGEGAAILVPIHDGEGTRLTMSLVLKPQGFAANLMLGAALATMPHAERGVIEGLERGMDDLAVELAKPDAEWDAEGWQPPGVPTRG
jgi:hypothetical protein